MYRHEFVDWDNGKAASNLRKHGVRFEDAAKVLMDDFYERTHVEDFDLEHSFRESRWITTGSHPEDRSTVLRIVWTERIEDDEPVTRLVNARKATRKERHDYEKILRQRSYHS